jgi:hypothetical protein
LFDSCTGLTNVTIGHGVGSIGNSAFARCTSLKSIRIPDGVTTIGEFVFEFCPKLTSVTIGSSVSTIGPYAFFGCTSLNDVTLPDSLVTLGEYAFYDCGSLTSVTIPKGVTTIGNFAFLGCTGLSNLAVDPANPNFSSVNGVVFDKTRTTLILCPQGKSDSCTIPNSVASIGNFAFYNCASLAGVYFEGNPPLVGASVFFGANHATVHYLPGTTGWEATFAGRPTVLWNPIPHVTGPADPFGFTITGSDNLVIVVEAATSLSNPDWTPVSTNTLTDGSSPFSDPQWMNHPARYYRLRSP